MPIHPELIDESNHLNYTLSMIGGKYCSRVIYYLASHNGSMRFNELRRCMGTIPCKTLSSTLKKLEDDNILLRKEFPQVPPKVEYTLTDRGNSLIPILKAMCNWGADYSYAKSSVQT